MSVYIRGMHVRPVLFDESELNWTVNTSLCKILYQRFFYVSCNTVWVLLLLLVGFRRLQCNVWPGFGLGFLFDLLLSYIFHLWSLFLFLEYSLRLNIVNLSHILDNSPDSSCGFSHTLIFPQLVSICEFVLVLFLFNNVGILKKLRMQIVWHAKLCYRDCCQISCIRVSWANRFRALRKSRTR